MKDETLYIRLLGDFSVCIDGEELSGENARSAHLWQLFKFMALNRKGPVATDRLTDLLWDEQECDNPLGALYTLMYRLRNLLGSRFDPPRPFFVFRQGCYEWDARFAVQVDAELFEAASERALACADEETDEALLLEAIRLYGGPLLANDELESWMIAPREFYKRQFSRCVSRLCAHYAATGRDAEILPVCERALGFDDCDEAFHYYYLSALLRLGQYAQAQRYADGPLRRMEQAFGIRASARTAQLVESIRYHGNPFEPNVERIAAQLMERDDFEAPFFCDLEAFRKIFVLEKRAALRSGRTNGLVCVSLQTEQGEPPADEQIAAVLEALRRPENFGLRRSDVLTRYSREQLLMFLPGADLAGAQIAFRRFNERFFANSALHQIKFHADILIV